MKLCVENFDRRPSVISRPGALRAYTLVEALVVFAMLTIIIGAVLSSIFTMQFGSTRLADYTSAMAILEAKVQDIRAVYYNPPNYPFTLNTVLVTNQESIDLNQAGTRFVIQGAVISKIQYEGLLGHLVTVTATFTNTPGLPMTVSLQTLVNKYSGGEQ